MEDCEKMSGRRVEKIQEWIRSNQLDAVLIYSPSNRRYLSGFAGSTGYAILTEKMCYFLVDFRYWEQASEQCPDWEVVKMMQQLDLFEWINNAGIKKLGIEKSFMTLQFYDGITNMCDLTEIQSVDTVLAELRMVKEEEELEQIQRACEITDEAFAYLLPHIKEGITEVEIDRILQDYMRQYPEVDCMADRFIVASGERGALPHGIAGERKIMCGDLITMDFGCNCRGYWSDVTRTVCLGKANEKQKEIYEITLEAQNAAIRAIEPGKMGKEIDQVARDWITKKGYGAYFGHGLGHSFGLDIHEAPRFSPNQSCEIPMKPGMIMTVEPGIYIQGFGGVRIEDDIVVTEAGCINLTKAAKNLIEL